MRRLKFVTIGIVALFAVALVGCDPIPHPNFTSKAGPASPVTFELLSGDTRFAVVQSTGAFGTIPGAGQFRVTRSDDTVVALPNTADALGISDDGSRVVIGSNPPSVWSSGTVLTAPAGAKFSDDLTYAVFRDSTDGRIKTWQTATQSIGEVETGFARPSGTTSAVPKAISDDGRTVEYQLQGSHPTERFVDLDADQNVDIPNNTNGDPFSGYENDFFALAATGRGLVHVHDSGIVDPLGGTEVSESWAELVSLPSGTVGRRYVNHSNEQMSASLHISRDGTAAWAYHEGEISSFASPGDSRCPYYPASFCTIRSHAVLIRSNGAETFDMGAGDLTGSDATPNARFLLITKNAGPYNGMDIDGPVRVLDWLSGNVETLDAGVNYTENDWITCGVFGGEPSAPCTLRGRSKDGIISNDGRTIATTTHTNRGWYEYVADPPS